MMQDRNRESDQALEKGGSQLQGIALRWAKSKYKFIHFLKIPKQLLLVHQYIINIRIGNLVCNETLSKKFNQFLMIKDKKNDTFEFNCQCQKLSDIFLTTSTNFSIVDSTNQQIVNLNFNSNIQDVLVLRICKSFVTLIFIILYIYQLKEDCQDQKKELQTEEGNFQGPYIQDKNLIYQGIYNLCKNNDLQVESAQHIEHGTQPHLSFIAFFCHMHSILEDSFDDFTRI
ncbi:unnamed protein product [Paramecium sonneborni]|uniref:Transmembrane protein n=1 Tax=Paramecium sonneborni TaxID=65129 RepID=A0A8S1QUQ2_9CILI|nr:unnamed protein product [Paramecium sonneborni]